MGKRTGHPRSDKGTSALWVQARSKKGGAPCGRDVEGAPPLCGRRRLCVRRYSAIHPLSIRRAHRTSYFVLLPSYFARRAPPLPPPIPPKIHANPLFNLGTAWIHLTFSPPTRRTAMIDGAIAPVAPPPLDPARGTHHLRHLRRRGNRLCLRHDHQALPAFRSLKPLPHCPLRAP